MPNDLTYSGAIVWQTPTHWAFFFRDKHIRRQVISVCREHLGRGHNVHSAWHTGHARVPHLIGQPCVPVILLRDPQMVTQLKLMFT